MMGIFQTPKYLKYREVYGKYRRQPPKKQEAFYEAYRMELTHYEAAGRYLDGVMNGRTGIPLKAWKAEQEKLTAERKELSRRYLALKDESKGKRSRYGMAFTRSCGRRKPQKKQPTHKQRP
ncbi:MAG: hypothetical protein ACLSH2_06720 [Oscillospiraceae bacterium]